VLDSMGSFSCSPAAVSGLGNQGFELNSAPHRVLDRRLPKLPGQPKCDCAATQRRLTTLLRRRSRVSSEELSW
jgi:hypothetical protein